MLVNEAGVIDYTLLDPSDCPACGRDSCEDARCGLPEWMPLQATEQADRMLNLAAGLLELGYAPIPLGADKRPLVKWTPYQLEAPTAAQLYRWWPDTWAAARGVGVVAGRPHNLVVLDADTREAWAWALQNLPAVRGVLTRRGGHLHFRHPARGVAGNRSGEKAVELGGHRFDVKALGGLAVAPYSRHPSGHVYAPWGDWRRPLAGLPELPAAVYEQAEDKPQQPAPTRRQPTRRTSSPAKSFDSYLAKRGGIPPEGSGSDHAVFCAAVWAKANAPELTEGEFVAAIAAQQPQFSEAWIVSKFRSAKGAA